MPSKKPLSASERARATAIARGSRLRKEVETSPTGSIPSARLKTVLTGGDSARSARKNEIAKGLKARREIEASPTGSIPASRLKSLLAGDKAPTKRPKKP